VPDAPVQVDRLPDARAFLDTAGAFLERREAEHNLLFGVAATLIADPDRSMTAPPQFPVVRRGTDVVAAGLMTPPYNLVLSWTDDRDAMAALAEELGRARVHVPGLTAPPQMARAFADAWVGPHGVSAVRTMAARIYRLERVIPPRGVPGRLRIADASDRDLLVAWTDAFLTEALGRRDPMQPAEVVDGALRSGSRIFYLWKHDGHPVSMAGVTGPTPHGIRVGPVYTPPADRGHGFASALTAAASQAQLDEGRRFVFLFTDLANPTSNRIYQAIGFEPVIDIDHWSFEPA
jgi:predicted GNAT family acetyltransferase